MVRERARTALHPSAAGRAWHEAWGRGDDWYDPDTNLFHFYGGEPQSAAIWARPESLATVKRA